MGTNASNLWGMGSVDMQFEYLRWSIKNCTSFAITLRCSTSSVVRKVAIRITLQRVQRLSKVIQMK